MHQISPARLGIKIGKMTCTTIRIWVIDTVNDYLLLILTVRGSDY